MGLCAEDAKKRRPFKTIIIPRGIINPNENNIIEIPVTLDATSSLIVKGPSDANSCFSVEPFKGDLTNIPVASYPTRLDTASIPPMATPAPVAPMSYPTVTITDTSERRFSQPEPLICEARPKMRSDFSCQVQPPCGSFHQLTPCNQQQQQQQQTCCPLCSRPTQQTQEAHSPVCPICAKASCKYFSQTGINRPCSPRFNQFPPLTCPVQTNFYGKGYPPCYSGPHDSILFPTRSQILSQSRDRFENELLNKILDDKVDKILKPVLFSLAKFPTEDDDNERFIGSSSSCTPKPSCSSIQAKCSREQCYVRKIEAPGPIYDDYRSKYSTSYNPSSSRRPTFFDLDYEPKYEPKRIKDSDSFNFNVTGRTISSKYPYADSDAGSSRIRYSAFERDLEDRDCFSSTPRKSYTTDRNSTWTGSINCPANASCQRRPNVSFDDRYKRDFENSMGNVKTPEKKVDLSSSGYSLTPRSSF